MVWDREKKTHRGTDGKLSTTGTSHIHWARITPLGKVHRVESVILRWNFFGGTFDKPDMTFVILCGPQTHRVFSAEVHDLRDRCVRCDSKWSAYQRNVDDPPMLA